MARKLSNNQIAALLIKASLVQVEAPKNASTYTAKTFWFEGRTLVVASDSAKHVALKALKGAGRAFGGFKCGWGGWNLTEGYTSNPLVSANVD